MTTSQRLPKETEQECEIATILLDDSAVSINTEKPFLFASGIASPIYCDLRLLMGVPWHRQRIVEILAERIRQTLVTKLTSDLGRTIHRPKSPSPDQVTRCVVGRQFHDGIGLLEGQVEILGTQGTVIRVLLADLVRRQRQIPVPIQCVPGQVKMQIDNQRLWHLFHLY